MTFTIIKAQPGLTTNEKILEVLENYSDGLTVKELSELLNRPISMIQVCLKLLVSCNKVTAKKIKLVRYYHIYSQRSNGK